MDCSNNLADVDFYGGQRGTENPSFEYGGSKGNFSWFTTGEYLHTDRGVEPPTSGPTAIHDTSNQGSGFGYFSYFLNPTTRLSLITGTAVNHFQIPANPNQPQVFTLIGVPVYPSADIHEGQLEQNYFGVLALQGTVGPNIDYQIRALQPLFGGFVLSRLRRRSDLQRRRVESIPQRLEQRLPARYRLPWDRRTTPFDGAATSIPSAPKSTIMSRYSRPPRRRSRAAPRSASSTTSRCKPGSTASICRTNGNRSSS